LEIEYIAVLRKDAAGAAFLLRWTIAELKEFPEVPMAGPGEGRQRKLSCVADLLLE